MAKRSRRGADAARAAARTLPGPEQLDLWPDEFGQPPWLQDGGKGAGEACTAFAIGAAAYWIELRSRGRDPGTPDFAFLYNNEAFLTSAVVNYFRTAARGRTPAQIGAFNIRAAARVASAFGVRFLPRGATCRDLEFAFTPAPPFAHFVAARRNRYTFQQLFPPPDVDPNDGAVTARHAHDGARHEALRQALLEGTPVVVGFDIPSDMAFSPAGALPRLAATKGEAASAHAVLVVGYDDDARRFRFRNSWGPDWGTNGYGTLPYDRVDSREATFGFIRLTRTDATVRPRVMFRSLRIVNRSSARVTVNADAYDGLLRYLGSCRAEVAAGETLTAHPVRWLDTYRLEIGVTPEDPTSGPARGVRLHVDDHDGAVASHAEVVIPEDPSEFPVGRVSGHRRRRLGFVSAGALPAEHLVPTRTGG